MIHNDSHQLRYQPPQIIPALIAAGAAIVGAVYTSNESNRQNKENTQAANNANYQIWREQQEHSKNAHQYEVEDLKKAGLNPILSAGGSGTSTPNAPSMAAPPPVNTPDIMGAIMPIVQAKMQSKELDLKTQQVENQTKLTNAEVAKKGQSTVTDKTKEELNRRDLMRGKSWDEIMRTLDEITQGVKKRTNKPIKSLMPNLPGNSTSPNLHPGM